ncbi:MAG: hypothetical protein J6U54_03970 [Clostridiales bacterium]|nr:hypothetical protein [Clostridiales bacterium]
MKEYAVKQIKNVLDAYWEQQERQRNQLHITIHMKQSAGLYVIAEDGGYDGTVSSVTMDINYAEQCCIWHFVTYLSYVDETDQYKLFGRDSSEWGFTEETKEPLHEIVKYATEILNLKDPKITFEVINGVLL